MHWTTLFLFNFIKYRDKLGQYHGCWYPGFLRCQDVSTYQICRITLSLSFTVYPKKYAHGSVVLCFVVVMQSFIINSHEVFIHIHQGCFAGTGAIVRLPQCQWSKPDEYGKISQCRTTTKHSKAKTVCIFLGIYCIGWDFNNPFFQIRIYMFAINASYIFYFFGDNLHNEYIF